MWTYLVFQEEKPVCGDYVDPRGHHWYVRLVDREPGIVMREPAPPAWYVEMGSDHPAYRLEPGDELRRFFNPGEIGDRREQLTTLLRGVAGFSHVGVSEDGFTLMANFGVSDVEGVPTEVDGMPVVVRVP
jgi:hypothetical protein